MHPFWTFARRMLRYRGLVVAALVMAMLSAGTFGAGLLAIKPVLEKILDADGRDLPVMAADLNAKLAANSLLHNVQIPRSWIDALPRGKFTAAVSIVCSIGIMTIFGAAVSFLHAFLSLTVVNRTTTNIRREAFHRVLRLPLRDIVLGGPTDAVARIMADTQQLGGGFNALLSKAVIEAFKAMAAVVVAFILDWRLALIGMLIGPVLAVVIRKLGKKIRRATKSAMQSQSTLYLAALEALQGLRVVKVHTTERYEAGRFHRVNKEVMREQNRVRTARALASPLIEALSLFIVGALALIAVKAILDNKLEPAAFIMTLGALGFAAAALKPLTGIVNDIQASAASADRLTELFAMAPEPGHGLRLPKLARHHQSIEFRNVTFTYPKQERPALDNINLTIEHGKTVAVVGPNGSGKTTLFSLVPRLFDPDVAEPGQPQGSILIDGHDVKEVSVRSLRRQIGVVTQETVLFRGSIAANIAYGAKGVTRERVIEAAKKARADEFITALPQGYDTPVAEQGLSLSGGQRQRLAIARAILRDPAILILDEATSMIDADSEAKIAAALGDFSRGRTCLIVAHRLSTVVNADHIVVMDQGRIVDQGGHAELLARCETYGRIARHQLVAGT